MRVIRRRPILGLFMVMLYTNSVLSNTMNDGDMVEQLTETPYKEDSTDRLVLASISLFFAVCLSVACSICAYCVYADDQILRNFVSNGIKLNAKVVEYTLTNHSRQEYTATIEYRYNNATEECTGNETEEGSIAENTNSNNNLSNNFGTIIRKQIKCVESDFVLRHSNPTADATTTSVNEMNRNTSPSKRPVTSMQQHSRPQSVCIEIQKDLRHHNHQQYSCDNDKFPSFDVAIFHPPRQFYIEVAVLPEHPTSAIGYQQLIQSLNHFPIIVLMTSLSVLAYFCAYVATMNVLPGREISVGLTRSLAVLVVCVTTEILILTFCCHDMILKVLKNEYDLHKHNVDDENYFNYKTEDETLYTMPSSFGGAGAGLGLTWTGSTS